MSPLTGTQNAYLRLQEQLSWSKEAKDIIWKKDSRNKDSKSIRRNEVLRDRQMDIIQSMRHKENTIGEFRIATTRGLLYDNRRIHTDRMVSEPSTTRGLLYLQYTTYCKFCQVKYK